MCIDTARTLLENSQIALILLPQFTTFIEKTGTTQKVSAAQRRNCVPKEMHISPLGYLSLFQETGRLKVCTSITDGGRLITITGVLGSENM